MRFSLCVLVQCNTSLLPQFTRLRQKFPPITPNVQSAFFTARKRSLGQGNVFTPVCHSVHRGGVSFPACITGHMNDQGCLHRGGSVCLEGGVCLQVVRIWGVCIQVWGGGDRQTSLHWILRDMVNKRVVRILLECNLVIVNVFIFGTEQGSF